MSSFIQQCLRSAKDLKKPLFTLGIYHVPCIYGKYTSIRQKRFIITRIQNKKKLLVRSLGKVGKTHFEIGQSRNTCVLDRSFNYYPITGRQFKLKKKQLKRRTTLISPLKTPTTVSSELLSWNISELMATSLKKQHSE